MSAPAILQVSLQPSLQPMKDIQARTDIATRKGSKTSAVVVSFPYPCVRLAKASLVDVPQLARLFILLNAKRQRSPPQTRFTPTLVWKIALETHTGRVDAFPSQYNQASPELAYGGYIAA